MSSEEAALSWELERSGTLVILPTAIDEIDELADEGDTGDTADSLFGTPDVAAYFRDLRAIVAAADPDRVNVVVAVWSFGDGLDESALEVWLSDLAERADEGSVRWASLPEVYDAFVEWEGR